MSAVASFFDIVASHARTDADALALITEEDGTRTYGELIARAAAVGDSMRARLGLEAGDRIGAWLPNHPAWIELYLAASAGRWGLVAANPEWTDDEIAFALGLARPAVIVCDRDRAERASALRQVLPSLRYVVVVGDDDDVPSGAVAYDALVGGGGTGDVGDTGGGADTDDGDGPAPSLIMFTSGTTAGRSKAVVGTIKGGGGADLRAIFGLTPTDRALVVTPFFHVNGLGGVTSALAHGASAVFPRRFSARRFWPLVDLYRPTYLFTLAPIVNILFTRPPSHHERHNALRVAVVPGAGGRAPAIEERLGLPVIDWYGMTEAVGSGTCTHLDEPRKPGSAGRRFPGSTMTILRDDGTEAAPNEVGEVVFALGSIVFDGYLADDEATRAATDGRWFRSGDLGYFDDDGYFFFVDRKKDIIRRGGENISSVEVEEALRAHPAVADVAVLGVPDDVLGERVAACVVPRRDFDLNMGSLRAFVAERLASFKLPERLLAVDDLPRTSTGKVRKDALRAAIMEAVDA